MISRQRRENPCAVLSVLYEKNAEQLTNLDTPVYT